MNKVKKTGYLSLRLEPQTAKALESLATQLGCNKSEIARLAISKQLEPIRLNSKVPA